MFYIISDHVDKWSKEFHRHKSIIVPQDKKFGSFYYCEAKNGLQTNDFGLRVGWNKIECECMRDYVLLYL